MRRSAAFVFAFLSLFATTLAAQTEPDYSEWTRILKTYYDPARGMDYAALKAKDAQTVANLRAQLGKVDATKLDPKQRLAYWMNVYNINTVDLILPNYPGLKSIRDLSTDPITRINVFKKDRVPTPKGMISLKVLEDDYIREAYKDARIHFAINCAARSCPPMRQEAFTGAQVDAQLDDQTRKFMAGNGTRVVKKGNEAVITTTKIMSGFPWFGSDFEKWPSSGGRAKFVRRYLPQNKLALLPASDSDINFEYDDYNWALNDAKMQ